MFYSLRIALPTLSLLALVSLPVLGLTDASWAGEVDDAASGPARAPSAWDDSHMQTRYPRWTGSGSSVPRLVLPEGRAKGSLPEGKTIYATPDRSWESGPAIRTRPRSSQHRATVLGAPTASRTSMSRTSGVRTGINTLRRSSR